MNEVLTMVSVVFGCLESVRVTTTKSDDRQRSRVGRVLEAKVAKENSLRFWLGSTG